MNEGDSMKYSIEFKAKKLKIIDQTKLPTKLEVVEITTLKQAYDAIKKLKVRGAPLIGVFAAYAVWIAVKDFKGRDMDDFMAEVDHVIEELKTSRPTAVNLFWALNRMWDVVYDNHDMTVVQLKKRIMDEAKAIDAEDKKLCEQMGKQGLKLVKKGDRILTHCNTGMLATAGDGTALSVIYSAAAKYSDIKVYADETRPLLQGSRLTAWELQRRDVDVTLICDNMAGYLMQKGMIDKIFVGADRITADGGVANKIGTYSLAILAKHHNIPFYVVAPSTTFDISLRDVSEIPIEVRDEQEVRTAFGKKIAPEGVKALNFAFDVTPSELITGIITEKGLIEAPYAASIKKFF